MKRLCMCLSQCLASRTERSTIRTYFMCLFTMVCYNGSACIRIVHHVSHQFSGFLAVSRSVLLSTRGICQCNNLSVPSVLCVSVFGCAIRYIGEKRRRKQQSNVAFHSNQAILINRIHQHQQRIRNLCYSTESIRCNALAKPP